MNGESIVTLHQDARCEWEGQGVIVPAGMILTAAHCLPAPRESLAFLADETFVRARRWDGEEGILRALFIDAVADIAVLSPVEDYPHFLRGIESLTPSLAWGPDTSGDDQPLRGWFYAHDKGWVAMGWESYGDGEAVFYPQSHISGGTSGGPIIDEGRRLIGIVSNTSIGEGPEYSTFVLLGAGLPPRVTSFWL